MLCPAFQQIRNYFQFVYTRKMCVDEGEIMRTLPTSLQDEVSDHIRDQLALDVHFLAAFNKKQWRDLTAIMIPCVFWENDPVCQQGRHCNDAIVAFPDKMVVHFQARHRDLIVFWTLTFS